MDKFHLAQINIARAKDTMESEIMRGFVARLDEINALADNAPGFVWRLQTEEGNATSIQAFSDPRIIANMSVWEDIDSLSNYVYKTAHVALIKNRDLWFDKMKEAHQALWWVPAGHTPGIEEGKEKLMRLQTHGPSAQAFTFAKPFDAPC